MNTARVQIQSGLQLTKENCVLVNRTGGSLSRGDLIALNLDFAATSGQAMVGLTPGTDTDSAAGYVLGAAITPTAANGAGILAVLDQDSLDDNAYGTFCLRGIVPVGCESGVAVGDFITPYTNTGASAIGTHATRTNAGTVSGLTRAELDSQTAVTSVLGIALVLTASETTALCIFDGFAFKSMVST